MLMKSFIFLVACAIISGFCLAGTALADASDENAAPHIAPLSRQYLAEGETINLIITASDPDGDPLTMWATGRPTGSEFTDNGDGTASFRWSPDFTGPQSSVGSPFNLYFWAGDGQTSSSESLEIIITNVNRKPVIIAADTVVGQSGDIISFDFDGYDPDGDEIFWSVLEAPSGATFNFTTKASFGWSTAFADSGYHIARVALADQYGAADTAEVVLDIAQTIVYALTIDTTSAYSGELVKICVNLKNLEPISGFDILINYDPVAMTIATIRTIGTRAESFEYFNYMVNSGGIIGDIRLKGQVDDDGVGATVLPVGEGPIVELQFYAPNGLEYAGFALPINFAFRDVIFRTDNVLFDPDGFEIGQNLIHYFNGYVIIKKVSESGIGDINQNGIAYEIGDAVYFINFFINPSAYPLTPAQRANSDVNRDGTGGTIADLVFLIHRIVNFSGYKKPVAGSDKVAISRSSDGRGLVYNSDEELGGLAMTLELTGAAGESFVFDSDMIDRGMNVKSRRDGNILRLLIYSENGYFMPSGIEQFISFENEVDFIIKDLQLSSADGALLNPVLKDDLGTNIPDGFTLHQNYPNPFNPATEIRFDLPHPAGVKLAVYSVLGRKIRILVDKELPSGSHSVIWDGRDHDGQTVSSGIYFYRIESGDVSQSKKMILIK